APLALAVGEPSDGEHVGALEQPDAVVVREALAGVELVRDVDQAGGLETGEGVNHDPPTQEGAGPGAPADAGGRRTGSTLTRRRRSGCGASARAGRRAPPSARAATDRARPRRRSPGA